MKDTIQRIAADAGLAGGGAQLGQVTGGANWALILGIVVPVLKEVIFRVLDKKKAKKEGRNVSK